MVQNPRLLCANYLDIDVCLHFAVYPSDEENFQQVLKCPRRPSNIVLYTQQPATSHSNAIHPFCASTQNTFFKLYPQFLSFIHEMPAAQSLNFSIILKETDAANIDEAESQGAYHTQNLEGEIQRRTVIDQTSKGELSILAELTHVIHGSLTPGGPKASLIVFDFRFTGSQLQGRRFRSVAIEISFAHGSKSPLGSTQTDPEVVAISPDGDFQWDHSSIEGKTQKGLTVNLLGSGSNPSQSGISTSWAKTTPKTKEGEATLFGATRIFGRSKGLKNSGKWLLRENRLRESGVPCKISTAILVRPQPNVVSEQGSFRAIVKVFAEVDKAYSVENVFKRMTGSSVIDPIFFQQDLKQVGPAVAGLQADNLAKAREDGILERLGCVPAITA
ncbi:hypothetical protein DFH27DRAFT_569497 [Peziza echinospora]|nr:hypothetical protein DFH27DRAFT_569497 [Peziza echinospora]